MEIQAAASLQVLAMSIGGARAAVEAARARAAVEAGPGRPGGRVRAPGAARGRHPPALRRRSGAPDGLTAGYEPLSSVVAKSFAIVVWVADPVPDEPALCPVEASADAR
jgi:hypothetical protein